MALAVSHEAARKLVQRDPQALAPAMYGAVLLSLRKCTDLALDAYVYEARRSDELARMYYQLKVSKAPNALRTWHGYSLAVDVISISRAWKAWDDPAWTRGVVDAFKRQGMKWGGDWTTFRDYPHFYWGACKPSPSDRAIQLLQSSGGVEAVWREVGAM